MRLIDLFRDMTYGELSNLFLSGFLPEEPESQPDPVKYTQLIAAINMGLTQLYKEFFLRSEEHYIQLYEQISTYKLHSDFAQTNVGGPEPIKYIMDTVDNPFQDNVLKIEEVYDEDGNKLPLNDITEDLSIYTPAYNTIQVPYPDNDSTLSVQFRATHPRIVYSPDPEIFDPATTEVELPNSLKEALQFYVASRIIRPLGGERTVESDNYFQMYKDSVRVAKEEGLEVQGEPGDWRFDQNGWV